MLNRAVVSRDAPFPPAQLAAHLVRRGLVGLGLGLVTLLVACGGASPSRGAAARDPGDALGPPTMRTLPSLDVARRSLTERMQFAWTLTEQAFQLPPPPVPQNATAEQLTAWTQGELQRWLAIKDERVQAARAELNVAAEEHPRQRILAGALVGLMYEDFGRVMLRVPLPTDLADEPEIAEMYRAVVRGHARPYLSHASRAYYACSRNALLFEGLSHWSGYCADRRERLPADVGQAGAADTGTGTPADGETHVTVIREK